MTGEPSLAGRTVLVTRPRGQAGPLVRLLRERGAQTLEAPVIEIERPSADGPLDRAIREAAEGRFAWVVVTSAAGAAAWAERSAALGLRPPRVEAKVAAVGSGTADALRSAGIEADLVPETFTTRALGEAFPRGPEGSGLVLLARADIAPRELEDLLRGKGWEPVRVEAYRTRRAGDLPETVRRALDRGRVDAVTFTSASTVDAFVALAGRVRGPAVVCLGPVTADAARRAGLEPIAVAEPHTIEGLARAVARALDRGEGR